MAAILPREDGTVHFVRCAACEALYIPDESPLFSRKENTMTWAVYWRTPPPRRRPTPCKHDKGMQWWNGKEWLDFMDAPTEETHEDNT